MAGRWVDNAGYFGPCRRRSGGRRLVDRRRSDEAGTPPSLGVMMRRIRVRLPNMQAPTDRLYLLSMLKGAMLQAEARRLTACVRSLQQAARIVAAAKFGDEEALTAADQWIIEAAAQSNEGVTPGTRF